MKNFFIFGLAIFSLIYNLSQYNYLNFIQEVNYLVFWNGVIVTQNNSFLVIFDMLISSCFLINIYHVEKIFMIFGV